MRCLPLLLLLVSGCSSLPAPEKAAEGPSNQETRTILNVPLLFSVADGKEQRALHTPLVRARVGDAHTLLILDSGATDPVFTRALAEELGLEQVPTAAGTDHGGASVATFVGTGPLRVQLADYTYTVDRPVIIEGPAPFEGWGIGGFLSPQLLHDQAWIEVDQVNDRLRILEGSEAGAVHATTSVHHTLSHASLPRVQREGDAARLPIVHATTPDGGQVATMFNTGGKHVELAPQTVPEETPHDQVATGRGVSGQVIMGTRSKQALRLLLGDAPLDAPEFIIREQGADYDAQLGSHVLRGTVLLMRADQASNLHWWR